MNKLKVFLSALALVCATGVAYAQPIPPEQLAAFRRLLFLVVWVPLSLTILCEIFLKYRLLLRFGAQAAPRALKFSAAASLAEFALTSGAMLVLYRPTVLLRGLLAGHMGESAAATVMGLLSSVLLFLVFWKLYALALKRFLGIGAAAAEGAPPASGWSLLRLSGVMAALHPLLLNLFTMLAYLLLVKRG